MDVPVTTAVLGGEVEVPTPTGKVALTVPAGTQSGQLPPPRHGHAKAQRPQGERGDLVARARIIIPRSPSDRERELYEELRRIRPGAIVLMAERKRPETLRVSVTDWVFEDGARDEPRYAISVVAARCGVRKGTLRRYEEWGLLEPVRTGRRRLYSEADIEHVQRIRRLVEDLGINLAGAAAVMHLRQQVIALQRELDDLRRMARPLGAAAAGRHVRRGRTMPATIVMGVNGATREGEAD